MHCRCVLPYTHVRVFHIAQTENSEILNLCPRQTKLKLFRNSPIIAEMKKARRVDGPSIFCFCLIPFLRKTTNSWTQRRFRNFNDFELHCTQNPSLSQPKMSLNRKCSFWHDCMEGTGSKWASNMRFRKLLCGNFSYMYIKLWDKLDSRKLDQSHHFDR